MLKVSRASRTLLRKKSYTLPWKLLVPDFVVAFMTLPLPPKRAL